MVNKDEARRELARRELARRQGGGTMMDVAKSGASGLARGAMDLAGLPGTIGDALQGGLGWSLRKGYELATGEQPQATGGPVERFFAGPTDEIKQQMIGGGSNPLSGQNIRAAVSSLTGGATEYDPQTTAGEYTSTIAEFLPGAAAFGGANAGNLLRFGALPGAASEGAGQATEGTALEPYARVAAALAAPGVPALAARAVSPMKIDPARRVAAELLKKEGIGTTAGQLSGSKALRFAESELGGSRAAQMMDDQAEAFTSAALSRAGGTGRATSDNMSTINSRLSQGFEDISARNTLTADQGLVDDLNKTMQEYRRVLKPEQRQIVDDVGTEIASRFKAGGGTISGTDYQTWRSRLSKRAKNARGSDNELADVWRGIRNALDSAMDRSVNPADAGEWASLHRQWGNMKTLERAAVGGGEDAAMGLISPARLRQSAATGNRGGYARGEGDFADLAKSGQALMTPLPNSGTPARLSARNLGAGLSAGVGGVTAGIPGMLAGLALPAVAGRALMSRPVQKYLANELLSAPQVADPRYAAIVAALLGRTGDRSTNPLERR